MSNTNALALVVIPCAAAKLDTAAKARDLYSSANFAHMLRNAEAEAADNARVMGVETRVMILSAEHGLLDLDTIVEPYNTKMGDAGCVEARDVRIDLIHIGATTISAMLPAAYYNVLAEAVASGNERGAFDIELLNVFEDAKGIGFQRGVASSVGRSCNSLPDAA